ncbi:MAG: AMP-binding protein [Bacteroidota bacterium]
MLWNNIHPKFRFNGKSFSKEELIVLGNSLVTSNLEFEKECGSFLLHWLDVNDFVTVQTSGTTGKPKQIKITKQAMVNSAIATGTFLKLKEGDFALCCLPVKYIAGKMMLVRAMVLGLELDMVEAKSNPLENNSKSYDFVAMVPLQVENSIEKLNQISKLLIGGAKVNQELETKILSSECEAYESYSMTETVTHVALKRIGAKTFKTLPNVTVDVDQRNCLVIEAPLLNSATIITNDLVELVTKTEFSWIGRVDNVVNSGGVKLFPEQIEEKLQYYFNQRFFVGGILDKLLGEKLVLVVEGNEKPIDLSIFTSLNKFEKPKGIYFLSEFLETETGKIKRKEILKSLQTKNPA